MKFLLVAAEFFASAACAICELMSILFAEINAVVRWRRVEHIFENVVESKRAPGHAVTFALFNVCVYFRILFCAQVQIPEGAFVRILRYGIVRDGAPPAAGKANEIHGVKQFVCMPEKMHVPRPVRLFRHTRD